MFTPVTMEGTDFVRALCRRAEASIRSGDPPLSLTSGPPQGGNGVRQWGQTRTVDNLTRGTRACVVARRVRIHVPDGWYPVMSRANGGEALCRSDEVDDAFGPRCMPSCSWTTTTTCWCDGMEVVRRVGGRGFLLLRAGRNGASGGSRSCESDSDNDWLRASPNCLLSGRLARGFHKELEHPLFWRSQYKVDGSDRNGCPGPRPCDPAPGFPEG